MNAPSTCATHMRDASAAWSCDLLMHVRTDALTDADLPSKSDEPSSVSRPPEPKKLFLNPSDMKLSATWPGRSVGLVDGSFVYFMWSSDWHLLYVGLTDNPDRRFAEHQRKPWWSSVHHMEVEQYTTRARACARERETIAGWDPIYNIARPRIVR